jgi:tetratricopeptide (TPR) repeat protein
MSYTQKLEHKMTELPTKLKNAICNNELIVFVGAGLSFNLKNINNQKLQGWSNLVEQILSHLKDKDYDVSDLIPLTKKREPIKILDLLESDNSIPKNEIYDFIKQFLDLNETNDFELHKKIYTLCNKIITTNYDTAFETAVPELRKNKALKGKNYELTKHKDPNASLLFKLHGCFENAGSMVLFPTNYNDLYNNSNRDAEHSLLVLRNIILNKSILFIGAGMGDFQINNIFTEIKNLQGDYNQQHFIITHKPLDSSLAFLTPIYISDHAEIVPIIDNLIAIKNESTNEESEKFKRIEKELKVAKAEIEALKNTEDKDKLLEREALKYFTKGLEFSLLSEHTKAFAEYKTAVELKPDFHQAYYNWGTSLGYLAQTK